MNCIELKINRCPDCARDYSKGCWLAFYRIGLLINNRSNKGDIKTYIVRIIRFKDEASKIRQEFLQKSIELYCPEFLPLYRTVLLLL